MSLIAQIGKLSWKTSSGNWPSETSRSEIGTWDTHSFRRSLTTIHQSVVGALTHAQETVEPMLALRDNLIPKVSSPCFLIFSLLLTIFQMAPCYIAAAMREAINEPSRVLYEAFSKIGELENHFPPDALRRLSDKTSVFKIVRESLTLLAVKEDSIGEPRSF